MIVGIRILYCFLAITLLSGCLGHSHIPGALEKSKTLNSDDLDELIGQSRELVVEKLGTPAKQFTLDDRQFMLYFTNVNRTYDGVAVVIIPIPVVIIPIPTGTKENRTVLICLRIELDSDNLVKQYKLKNGTAPYTPRDESTSTKCLRHYFNKKERDMIYKVVTKTWQRDSFIKPSGEIDLSGAYEARITREMSPDYSCFNQKRKFFIELEQDNDSIQGRFLSGITGTFEGTVEGDKLKFIYYTARCAADIKGEWILGSDGSSLEGYGGRNIKWKLHRI